MKSYDGKKPPIVSGFKRNGKYMPSENGRKRKSGINYWVSRWDSMQEYYNPDRKNRFASLLLLIKAKGNQPKYILDLGCGTGSIMLECLKSFPLVHVIGIDLDFTLLELALGRLKKYSNRFTIFENDFRDKAWQNKIPYKFDAIVSATALHWLTKNQLIILYSQVYQLLKSGGIFLNADHVSSSDNSIQAAWKKQKSLWSLKKQESREPWQAFWDDYLNMLGNKARIKRNKALKKWNGIEEGLPLDWHFDQLKIAGFKKVDCFYRFYCDAIYGGIKA